MADGDLDTSIRMAAFEHDRQLSETHDHLTAADPKPGWIQLGNPVETDLAKCLTRQRPGCAG